MDRPDEPRYGIHFLNKIRWMIPSGTGDPQSVEANGNHAGAYPREAGIFGDRQRSARFGGLMVPALAALTVLTLLAGGMRAAEGRLVFYTGFEASEGYNSCCELRGQQGWIAEGSGGNGLVTNFFAGFGQQAFIGYTPPAPKDRTLSLWRPLPEPVPRPGESVVKFSVLMQVEDPWPGNGKYDDFYWSAYNSDGQRLFSIDFDNWSAEILYDLDDPAGYQPTGFTFSNTVIYWLDVFMNFRRNTWMAMLNGVVVVDSQPITTKPNVRLNLSDMDAVWAVRLQGSPGENYLLFDEYTLTIEPGETIPPVLELVGRRPGGQFELIVHGERGLTYAIDVSEDLVTWETLATRRLDDGFWQFLDSTAPNYPRSFYRAREVAE